MHWHYPYFRGGGTLPIKAESEVTSSYAGECGDNVIWLLSEKGTLTISGTGKMYDYEKYAHWEDYYEEIFRVEIESGVTNIGAFAFSNLYNFTVSIPDSVTSIEDGAFYYAGISEITLPKSLEFIGADAFSGSNIESITIPESVEVIGN